MVPQMHRAATHTTLPPRAPGVVIQQRRRRWRGYRRTRIMRRCLYHELYFNTFAVTVLLLGDVQGPRARGTGSPTLPPQRHPRVERGRHTPDVRIQYPHILLVPRRLLMQMPDRNAPSGPALSERLLSRLLTLDDCANGAQRVAEVLEDNVRDALAVAERGEVVLPARLLLHVQHVCVPRRGHVCVTAEDLSARSVERTGHREIYRRRRPRRRISSGDSRAGGRGGSPGSCHGRSRCERGKASLR